jgi:hypothetical protein
LKVLCHNVERCGITERVSEIKYGTAIYWTFWVDKPDMR